MRSVVSVEIAAPPGLVFDLVSDVEVWDRLLPHYVQVQRQRPPARRVTGVSPTAVFARYVAIRPIVPWLGLGLPIVWRAFAWPDPDLRHLSFLHVGGLTDGMEVVWTIEPTAAGCRLSIEHELRRPPPLPEMIDRLVVQPIAGRTLATVRSVAEAIARSGPVAEG